MIYVYRNGRLVPKDGEPEPQRLPTDQARRRIEPLVGPASDSDTTYPSRYITDDYGFLPKKRS